VEIYDGPRYLMAWGRLKAVSLPLGVDPLKGDESACHILSTWTVSGDRLRDRTRPLRPDSETCPAANSETERYKKPLAGDGLASH